MVRLWKEEDRDLTIYFYYDPILGLRYFVY